MNAPWTPVIFLDITGSVLMVLISFWCAAMAKQLVRQKPDDTFRNYIFLFTLAIVFFAISRSFGHLVKQLLLLNDMDDIWRHISPFSGAVNSTTFVVIFAFGISFYRFQKVHAEIEYYKSNLEELITDRTEQLEKSKNTLENILNNSKSPVSILTWFRPMRPIIRSGHGRKMFREWRNATNPAPGNIATLTNVR